MFASLFIKLSGILFFVCALFFAEEAMAQKTKKQKLKIELGQHFRNDNVKIYLDKKLVYNKTISTPDSALITDVFEVTKPKKSYTITIEVNGVTFEKSSPKQAKELDMEDYSLLVNYNRETEEVELKTKIVIVLYD
jgi:hypothetical protein